MQKSQKKPRKMKGQHNLKCERATTPQSQCKCECGGKMHGMAGRLDEFMNDPLETVMTVEMGGQIKNAIQFLSYEPIICSCGKKVVLEEFLGYPHEGGLKDKKGDKYWLYAHCPYCKYDWSWWKLKNKIGFKKKTEVDI